MAAAENILVLGHRGLLGRALLAACGGPCLVLEAPRGQWDLATWAPLRLSGASGRDGQAAPDLEQARRALPALGGQALALHDKLDLLGLLLRETRPGLVINCIGFTDVEQAEAKPGLAMAVNARGAQAVARACAQAGAHLLHVSTDFVFDGQAARPYREDDPAAPLSAYGRSKLEGERLVLAELPGTLMVRSAWLFGPGRVNFVDKVLERGRLGRPFPVVDDQVGSPTYTSDLAQALLSLGRRWLGGVLHVVNQGQASRLELARQALELAGLDPALAQPASSAQAGGQARRPAYSVLDAGRAALALGAPLPPWRDALRRYLCPEEEERP